MEPTPSATTVATAQEADECIETVEEDGHKLINDAHLAAGIEASLEYPGLPE
eukprot:COSAG02_NODE_51573_length_313_cov_0.822430_1_plen_51_part_10